MSSSFAPDCWHTTTLGSVIELTYGKSLPAKVRDGQSFPVFGSNGEVGKHSTPLVKEPGLIVGRKGSFGEVHISEEPFFPIDTTYYVDNFHGQPIRYWFYQLRFLPLNQLNRATAIPGLNREDAYSQEIALPPIAEQKVIADKLDTLLAQVENTKARLERIPQILKRFRQSVLAAAVSGRLTEEWRTAEKAVVSGHDLHKQIKDAHTAEGGHARGNASKPTVEAHDLSTDDLPGCWDVAEMRDVCVPGKPITYGILKPGPELDEGVPYIRVADFPGNKLNMANIKKTSIEIDQQFKRARLSEGDLLLSIRGSVGRLIKIPASLDGANITQDTARLSISPLVSTDFVYWALLAESTQRRMKNATRGVAVRGINIGDVRALQVPLPPLTEQTEIVRRVDQLFAHADRIEHQVNSALARVDNLTQSILAKAFRGELTEQWRTDNPELISGENSAEALLERIKAEREISRKQPKKRRTGIKKKAGKPMTEKMTVIEALKQAGKPLTGQQLLTAAGYSGDSNTEELDRFFLDLRDAIAVDRRIVKLKRDDDGQDWFTLTEKDDQPAREG